jgi:hypothetical protein
MLIVLGTSACAPKLMKLPTGAGSPASDIRDALADASSTCHGVSTMSAELGVTGSVGGQRLRSRLLIGMATPASARLEAVAPFGPPVFIFVARGADATLLLPRDERVLEHGKPEAVLEALTGVPLDPADLRRALTGCPNAADRESGRAVGDDWRVATDGPDEVYLHRATGSSAWHIVAIIHRPKDGQGWRAEYRDFESGLPRGVRLVSNDPDRFDLRAQLSQVEINTALGPEVFRVDVPRTAQPITIQELSDARPGLRKN